MASALIARDVELGAIEQAIADGGAGQGSVVVIEGPAGIGKTALLDHARATAQAAGARVLGARASELDRAFGFGVVLQLVEPPLAAAGPEGRKALMAGAAGRAEVVLAAGGAEADEAGHAVLHGLYWLVVNLAESGPLVLLVDDLHWADVPSLRFLEYLGRRLDGLAVTVVATTRANEPGAPQEVLDELAGGPAATVLHPGPLDTEAVAQVLGSALDRSPDAAFNEAALRATGGNPLLLTLLAREASALGLEGSADEGGRLEELGARGVAPAVQRRLRPLGATALAAAQAAAIAGERAGLADVAALAGLEPEEARATLARLAAAGVLQPGGWTFVHPLVRAAVLEATAPAERARLHGLAAVRVRERGAGVAEAALHWLQAEPAGDARAVADLRAAAEQARASGAPEVAIDHLRRALLEPPPVEQRVEVLLDLGELEIRAGRDEGPERLRSVLAQAPAGNATARARAALGNHLVHTDPMAAFGEVEQGLAEATEPALALRLETFVLEALIFADAFAEAREARFAAGRAAADPSPAMLAHLAVDGACAGRPRAEVQALAERALAGGALLAQVGPHSSTWNLATHALRFAEAADEAARALEDGERYARTHGLEIATLFIEQSWAYWHRDFGSVATGAARARLGLEAIRRLGFAMTMPTFAGIAAENLAFADRLDEAAAEIELPMGAATDTYIEPFALSGRGFVRFLQRRHEEAEADLRRVVALCDARGWAAPNAARGRLRLAEVLIAKGERDEAVELMDHDLRVAEAAGLPGSVGMALRVSALTLKGDEAIDVLREAARILAPTPYRLELGWVLHDLGARLRIRGDRRDAREPLRQALDLAARTEAARLGRHVRGELEASGGRPRRDRLSGTDALTPAERRVADMVAEGLTNREVAETLWITMKTVEVHLGRIYAKLGISSRRQLGEVLAAPV